MLTVIIDIDDLKDYINNNHVRQIKIDEVNINELEIGTERLWYPCYKGHTEVVDPSISPTCTMPGRTAGKHCSVCGEIIIAQSVIPELGHEYESVVTDPTCTKQGYTTHTCTRSGCGHTYKDNYTEALGHSYGDWSVILEPTCTETGTKRRNCTRTNCTAYETETIAALGHTSSDWIIDVESTTATEGSKHKECTVCGEILETATIPKLEPLTYTLSIDETYYSVEATDTHISGDINILSDYNGKPVTTIASNAFKGCSEITGVVIPNSVTYIGEGAFRDCDSLTGVYISDLASWCNISFDNGSNPLNYAKNLYLNGELVTELVIPDSVTSIGIAAFSNCRSIVSVVIPNSVTTIGGSAFNWCNSITSIIIPDSVTSIGEFAFHNCTSLTSIVIPNSVTSIAFSTFSSCSSLTSVVVPDSVTSIGGYAFHNCYNLIGIVIPDSVTSIGDNAFEYCNRLTKVYYTGVDDEWAGISVGTDNSKLTDATIYYYSETHPTEVVNCWRYVDSVPTAWCNDIVIDEAVAATCMNTGLTEGSHCGVCGTVTKAQTIVKALGHDYTDWVASLEPTCTTTGTKSRRCRRCETVETMSTPSTGHNYTSVVTEPTCTEQGYTTHTCTNAGCGDSYKDTYTDATGHTWGAWSIDIKPTCTMAGTNRRDCSVCDAFETQTVAATGHNWNTTYSWNGYSSCTATRVCSNDSSHTETATATITNTVTTAATCTTAGVRTYTATFSASWAATQTKTETISATGHNWGEPTYTWNSTKTLCTAIRTCQNDSSHTEKATASELAGTISNVVTTAATCTTAGVRTYTATFDYNTASWAGRTTTTVAIPATGHNYSTVVTEPTCTEKGYTTYTCNTCGHSYTEETPALGHDWGYAGTIEPNCTDDGEIEYTCANCGAYKTEINPNAPALGHTWVDATCTEPKTCSVCGETEGAALGHTEVNYPDVEPTTTSIGYQNGSYCSVCGTVIESREKILATPVISDAVLSSSECIAEIGVKNNNSVSVTCYVSLFDDSVAELYTNYVTIPANAATLMGMDYASTAILPLECYVYFEASGYEDSYETSVVLG